MSPLTSPENVRLAERLAFAMQDETGVNLVAGLEVVPEFAWDGGVPLLEPRWSNANAPPPIAITTTAIRAISSHPGRAPFEAACCFGGLAGVGDCGNCCGCAGWN